MCITNVMLITDMLAIAKAKKLDGMGVCQG